MKPPDCCTIPCTVAKPRPVPLPTSFVVKNGSKIRGGVEVDDLRLQHLLAAEREQLARELAGALRGFADLSDVIPGRRAGREVLEQQLAITEDYGEQVIEVMRHAAGQPPDRLHLLRL